MTEFEAGKTYALRRGGKDRGIVLAVIDGRAYGYLEVDGQARGHLGVDRIRGAADWDAKTGLYHIYPGGLDLVDPAITY